MEHTDINPLTISDGYRGKLNFWHNVADTLFNKMRFPGSRKLYRNMSKMFLPELKSKILTPTIYGFDLIVGPENAYNYYYLGFYEPGALEIFKKVLKEGDVFVDVGANIGLMAFYAAMLVGEKGKVLAFEPTDKYYPDLKEAMNRNGFKNIAALQLGLGSKKERLPIYLNNICPSLLKTGESDPVEWIEIDTLDAVLEENKVAKVKLIKIDVEGFELEVIKGGKKVFSSPDAPIVCIEYWKEQQDLKENGMVAIEVLKTLNSYKFFQLVKSSDTISKLTEIKELKDLHDNDNVFCLLPQHEIEFRKKDLIQ